MFVHSFQIVSMGNTSSDSLDHSFKRLRLSQTEQLSQVSPSGASPKRKVSMGGNSRLGATLKNNLPNNVNEQLPTLLWKNNDSSVSAKSVITSVKPTSNQEEFDNFTSDEELIRIIKSSTRSDFFNDLDIPTYQVVANEHIKVKTTDTKVIPEISDDDLMAYVKQAYIKKEHK